MSKAYSNTVEDLVALVEATLEGEDPSLSNIVRVIRNEEHCGLIFGRDIAYHSLKTLAQKGNEKAQSICLRMGIV